MPSGQYPVASYFDGIRIIDQVQSGDSRSTYCRTSLDSKVVDGPSKMCRPTRQTQMKKRDRFTGFRISR